MQRQVLKIAGRLVLGLGAGVQITALTARPAEAGKRTPAASAEDVTAKVEGDLLKVQVLGQPGRHVQLWAGPRAERGAMKKVEGGAGVIGADGRLDLAVAGRALGGNGVSFVGLQISDDADLRRGVSETPVVQIEVAAGRVRGDGQGALLGDGSVRTVVKAAGRGLVIKAAGRVAPQ